MILFYSKREVLGREKKLIIKIHSENLNLMGTLKFGHLWFVIVQRTRLNDAIITNRTEYTSIYENQQPKQLKLKQYNKYK